MAMINDVVRPGDVISSDLLNRIIALLNDHDSRIGSGGSTTNLISGFDPVAEQNVGRNLTVFGLMDFPLHTNILSIDGVPITPDKFLLGSGSSQIIFEIPSSIPVPAGGSRPVVVRLVNSHGSGERQYSLKPAIAGPPTPDITGAVDHGTGAAPLRSGANARLIGKNFASPATANKVRIIFNPGTASPTAFPANVGDSLVIDATQSVINPAPADCTLVVMMPNIGADLIPVVGQQAPIAVELRAPGANVETEGAQIRRMA